MTPRSQSPDEKPAAADGARSAETLTAGAPDASPYGPPSAPLDLDEVRRTMTDLEDSNRLLFEQVRTLQAMLASRAAASNGVPTPGDRPEVRAAIARHEAIRLALLDPVNQWLLSRTSTGVASTRAS